ncbi:hypothetical protein AB5J55_35190 [Streptomyces sp. R11]|uniref:Uncharacterized protein n=1 Tax=Streptomyces sp. R11 TaxID=3238625 RepID=A0AB39N7W1_9ACTN
MDRVIAYALAVGVISGPFISAALYALRQAGRVLARRWDAWEHAALTCPHRSHLRRYRWPINTICAVRIGTEWINAIRRRPT